MLAVIHRLFKVGWLAAYRIPFVALRRKAILNAESAFRQSAKKVLGRKITDLEVEQLLADEAARANAEVEARKARQLGVQSLSHVNRLTRAVESGQRSVEAYKDRQSSRKDGLGLDYESQARLTTVRLKVEQIQLVSGVELVGLGRVGLQGA